MPSQGMTVGVVARQQIGENVFTNFSNETMGFFWGGSTQMLLLGSMWVKADFGLCAASNDEGKITKAHPAATALDQIGPSLRGR